MGVWQEKSEKSGNAGSAGPVLHNVLHPAVQYAAEHFNRMGADAFVPLQPGDLRRADAIGVDERVLAHTLCAHGDPKPVVGNHQYHPLFSEFY